jgi:hypothetical protein
MLERSELHLPKGSSSGAICSAHSPHGNSQSRAVSGRIAARSADSDSGRLDPLRSPPPALTVLRPARSHPDIDKWKTAVPSTSQPAGPGAAPTFIRRALFRATQYLTGYRTLCLSARLYTLLLTAINICYRN